MFFPPQPIRAQLCCCFDSQTQFAALHRPPGKAYRLYPVGDRLVWFRRRPSL
jgi:hypothetical protein